MEEEEVTMDDSTKKKCQSSQLSDKKIVLFTDFTFLSTTTINHKYTASASLMIFCEPGLPLCVYLLIIQYFLAVQKLLPLQNHHLYKCQQLLHTQQQGDRSNSLTGNSIVIFLLFALLQLQSFLDLHFGVC